MSNRPTVGIIGADGANSGETHSLPAVFSSPIRPDIVQYVAQMIKAQIAEAKKRSGSYTLAWPRTRDNHTL